MPKEVGILLVLGHVTSPSGGGIPENRIFLPTAGGQYGGRRALIVLIVLIVRIALIDSDRPDRHSKKKWNCQLLHQFHSQTTRSLETFS